MIRTFWGEALEVTPDVERIVLSLMRVRADGTIRPQLARRNHFRILRAIWDHDPIALHTVLRVPALAILAHGGDMSAFDGAKRDAARALADAGAPTRVSWMRGIHDLPLQHPEALAARIERFAASTVR